jgi:hypothetical protein
MAVAYQGWKSDDELEIGRRGGIFLGTDVNDVYITDVGPIRNGRIICN